MYPLIKITLWTSRKLKINGTGVYNLKHFLIVMAHTGRYNICPISDKLEVLLNGMTGVHKLVNSPNSQVIGKFLAF